MSRCSCPEKICSHKDILCFFIDGFSKILLKIQWDEHVLVADLGRGRKRKGSLSPLSSSASCSLCYRDGIVYPFFTEGPPLDLIKFSLGYAATFEMNMHLGPFRSRTIALKWKALLCIGISIHIQLAFTGGNGIFCVALLLNWWFPKKALFHFMVVFIIICFWRNLPRVTDQKTLLLVENTFMYIPSWWCNILKIALMLCLIRGLSICF